jgi:hypothetical protein
METFSSFSPVPFVSASEPDECLYEPTRSVSAALAALEQANRDCQATPTLSNVTEACRKCRAAFGEFISETLSVGAVARTTMLPQLALLLRECHARVAAARPLLDEGEPRRLADGYLRHIEDRISLAEVLRVGGIDGYIAAQEAWLLRSADPVVAAG